MDIFLGIVALVILGVCLVVDIAFLQYYRHPEDRWGGWFPRFLIIAGLLVCQATVLMVPFDIANGEDPTYPTDLMWDILVYALTALVVALIPFGIFYYESMDENGKMHICSGLIYAFLFVVIFAIVFFFAYIFLGIVEIPVVYQSGAAIQLTDNVFNTTYAAEETIVLEEEVSFPTYLTAMISFLGQFVFCIFGGIGLFSLPFSLINDFRRRPKGKVLKQFAEHRNKIAQRAKKLIDIGEELKRDTARGKPSRQQKKLFKRFENAVELLDQQNQVVRQGFYEHGGSPLLYYAKAFIGSLFILMSLVWFVHIILYVFFDPPIHPVLNSFFLALDDFFPMLGVLAYGLFALYLFWAVLHGASKVGLRLLIFSIHKMKPHETTLNSILFNVLLLNLGTIPIVQFCVQSFQDYARLSTVSSLLGVSLPNLKLLSYAYEYFIIGFMGFAALALLWLLLCPGRSEDKDLQDLSHAIQKWKDL